MFVTKLYIKKMQTPYNSNKCVALTSSQRMEEKREKREIHLGGELIFAF